MSKPRDPIKAPFPYFGGKTRVASLVWARLGDPANYIEPFCGSAAMLLLRPSEPRIETINDADCYVANFWRATSVDPEAVAAFADGPVNEADLHARHRWLVLSEASAEFREKMRRDPEYFDAKVAGWWAWGLCCWIGSGWCQDGQLRADSLPREKVPLLCAGNSPSRGCNIGPHEKRPNIGGLKMQYGKGIHARGPDPGDTNRPQLADAFSRGRGVNGNDSAETCRERREWLIDWFGRLRDRLRTVRVCCGEWSRVCGSPSTTTRLGLTGIFLDPPYPTHGADGTESRNDTLYATDAAGSGSLDKIRDEVLAYCREHGLDPLMRICVAGYDTDGYAALESEGWTSVAWKAQGGYGNRSAKGKENAGRERLWFSPNCVNPSAAKQASLFAESAP